MDAAERSWEFIETHIVDREHGEWFWLVSKAGVPGSEHDKVGPWKCPYHNSRTCFEVMERLDTMKGAAEAQGKQG
jgi:mannobiose 2-epimerase